MSKRPAPRSSKLEKVEAQIAERELQKEREADEDRERMQAQARADYEVLGFDYDDISWDDANDFADMTTRQYVASEDDDAEALQEARAQIRDFLARVITYVPDDWFVSSLNGSVKDFTEPDLYRSVKATKTMRLIAAMNYGLEENQKN